MEFTSPVPFVETLVAELSALRESGAVPILRDILGTQNMPGRGEAAIGLGATRSPDAWDALVKALEDGDAWVRLMAYRGLKYSVGRDAPCNWMYGTPAERKAAVQQYKDWVAELGKKPEEKK